jgi:hypothetical protein
MGEAYIPRSNQLIPEMTRQAFTTKLNFRSASDNKENFYENHF